MPGWKEVVMEHLPFHSSGKAARLLGMGAQAGQAKPARSIMRVLLALLPRQAVARRRVQ